MFPFRKIVLSCAIGLLIVLTAQPALAAGFKDPRDTPAASTPVPDQAPMLAVARAGMRLVAVGPRGVILLSEDDGKTWRQMASPIESDLVALSFADDQRGWAAGHDGVVLRTEDGGRTWSKQLDGREAVRSTIEFYQRRLDGGDASAGPLLQTARQNAAGDGELPWLGVRFVDVARGFLVGPFGMLAATTDGGVSWQPWMHRIDNPQALHLTSIAKVNGDLYITAEKGFVFKFDRAQERFLPIQTGYAGTLFGLVGRPGLLIAFGLRGTVLRSVDGVRWQPVRTGLKASVTAGAMLPDGRVLLLTQGAESMIGDVDAAQFKQLEFGRRMPYSELVVLGGDAVVVAGLRGISIERIK